MYNIDWGLHGLLKLIAEHEFQTVLDIGSGRGEHARLLRDCGKDVKSVDFHPPADYVGDFFNIDIPEQFDAIWCSHVLEHQRNVGLFLDRLNSLLKPGGILSIIVPTHPAERLVGGHLTVWSAYLLCYNLILAGFNCREAKILKTYELSLIVQKDYLALGAGMDNSVCGAEAGDVLADLEQFFPMPAKAGMQPSNPTYQINWGELVPSIGRNVTLFSKNITKPVEVPNAA